MAIGVFLTDAVLAGHGWKAGLGSPRGGPSTRACARWSRVEERVVFIFSKRAGQRGQVRFMPGCLVLSLLLSIGLTVFVNVLIRLF